MIKTIRIYGEQYEVDKFIEECLPTMCWRINCEDYNNCIQCLSIFHELEIHYDAIKTDKT